VLLYITALVLNIGWGRRHNYQIAGKGEIKMSKWVLSALMVAGLGAALTGTAKADFINGSFETGDLTGWTASNGQLNPYPTYGAGMDEPFGRGLAALKMQSHSRRR
jgi:hypothetical protein